MEFRAFFWLIVFLMVGAWIGDKWPGFNVIGRVTGTASDS